MRISLLLLLFMTYVVAHGQENLQFDRLAFSIMEGAWDPTNWLVIDSSGRMVEIQEKDRLKLTAKDHEASVFLTSIEFEHSTRMLETFLLYTSDAADE